MYFNKAIWVIFLIYIRASKSTVKHNVENDFSNTAVKGMSL